MYILLTVAASARFTAEEAASHCRLLFFVCQINLGFCTVLLNLCGIDLSRICNMCRECDVCIYLRRILLSTAAHLFVDACVVLSVVVGYDIAVSDSALMLTATD